MKYLPKICIDIPMMAQWIKFNKIYYDKDSRWITRIFGREEYQRKEQVRSLDTSKTFKVVYDNIDRSPFYDASSPYLNEK